MAKSISRRLADSASPTGAIDGTLSTAAQTNITSVGTLSSLAVTGTVTADSNLLIGQTTTSPANVNGTIAYGGADAGIIYLQRQTGTDQLRFYTGGNRLGFVNTASSTFTLGTANFPLVFQTNDTERMRIDSSGAVGIGTSSPATGYRLDISGSSGYDDVVRIVGVGTNIGPRINLTPTGTGNSRINATANSLLLQTAGTERMRIDSSGNVGIGNSSAVGKLEVYANNTVSAAYIRQDGTGPIQSWHIAGGAEKMRLESSGNVGIGTGTDSPLVKLDVRGSASAPASSGTAQTGSLRVSQTVGTGVLDMGFYTSSNGTAWLQSTNKANLATNYDIALQPNGGNVGIGTTSPANPLSISVQTHGLYSQHRPSNGNGTGQEMYYKFNTADGTPEIFSSIYSEIESNANGAESGKIALRAAKAGSLTTGLILIGSTGNVGIGTLTPDAKLSVGVGTAADGIKFDVSYSPVNSLPRGTIAWDDGNASNALTGQIDTRYNGTTVDMHFGSLYNSGYNTTSRLIIKGNGNVEIPDGNLSFASGHGIDFSASANYSASSSELLDDYEEGLWYPYLGTDTQLGSASSANSNNKYVKIGRLVHCTGWFNAWNYANVTSGTYMMIKNLPFPPEHHSTGLRLSYTSNLGGSTYGYGHTSHNAFYLLIGGSTGSGTHYTRAAAPGSGTAYAMINIVYYTAS